jgi:hypothetical protein
VLASALTGQSPAGFSCLDRSGTAGDTKGLRSSLQQTFGNVDDSADGSVITIRAGSARRAWAYAHYAVANASLYGVTTVKIKIGPGRPKTSTFLIGRRPRRRSRASALKSRFASPPQ